MRAVDASRGPPIAAPSIIGVDRPALTFRCEHVNVIVGVVVGMVVTAKQPIFVGLLLHDVWGLSLHDAIFNDEMRVPVQVESANVSQGGQIFTDISVLFLLVQIHLFTA
jgi:hypothetical protein